MAIVTLTSDWNKDDYYTASVKGKILSRFPETSFIDITNQVPPFGVTLAAFQLKNSYKEFPPGTIHIVAVNNSHSNSKKYVALNLHQHFFIGYNNGIFSLLSDDSPLQMVEINLEYTGSFPEQYVFSHAACEIIQTGKLDNLGQPLKEISKQLPVLPAIEENIINGSIIYIDSYRNAFTNISKELFEQIGKGRKFEIFVQSNHNRINHLNTNYHESSPGELLAMFNSINLLEIAINGGNAADLLNLSLNSSVRIKFSD